MLFCLTLGQIKKLHINSSLMEVPVNGKVGRSLKMHVVLLQATAGLISGWTHVAHRNITPPDYALQKSGVSAAEHDGLMKAFFSPIQSNLFRAYSPRLGKSLLSILL